jgi:F0F1-type ATP synthase assembly protein I
MKSQAQTSQKGRATRALAALLLGLVVGAFLHYLLYRYSLPSKPFIYVAF